MSGRRSTDGSCLPTKVSATGRVGQRCPGSQPLAPTPGTFRSPPNCPRSLRVCETQQAQSRVPSAEQQLHHSVLLTPATVQCARAMPKQRRRSACFGQELSGAATALSTHRCVLHAGPWPGTSLKRLSGTLDGDPHTGPSSPNSVDGPRLAARHALQSVWSHCPVWSQCEPEVADRRHEVNAAVARKEAAHDLGRSGASRLVGRHTRGAQRALPH